MKKNIFIICFFILSSGVYGQTEFVDFVSVGFGYKIPSDDNSFPNIIFPDYLAADYSIGTLFHGIDLAALVNIRTNTSDYMIGGELNYFGFNLYGFGLSGGVSIDKKKDITGYIRASAFFHLVSSMKLTLDIEYRFDSRWDTGIMVSIPLISGHFRGNNIQYSHLGTDEGVIGKWDDGAGIMIEFKSGQRFEMVKYHDMVIEERRRGYYSTGEIFGDKGMRMVYTDKKRNEGVGFEYTLEEGCLKIEVGGKEVKLRRKG
jgi:hypothetical protein